LRSYERDYKKWNEKDYGTLFRKKKRATPLKITALQLGRNLYFIKNKSRSIKILGIKGIWEITYEVYLKRNNRKF